MVEEIDHKMDRSIKELAVPFTVGIFISFPAMCVIMLFQVLRNAELLDERRSRYFLYSALGICMGLLNTTKPVDASDLGYYYWLYERVGEISLKEFFETIPKEPLYHIYTLVGRILTFGSFPLFMVLTTMIMYLAVMTGYDILVRKLDLNVDLALYAALLLWLFPQYFFYTAQIIRQVLAGSLAFYCIVKSMSTGNRYATIGIFLTGFIHASAFVFSIYYILWYTRNLNNFGRFFIFLASAAGFAVAMKFMSLLGGGEDSTLVYAARRSVSKINLEVKVGLFPRLISLSILPLGFIAARMLRNRLFNIFLSVAAVVALVILINWNADLMVLRFMEYTYIFLPIMAVLALGLAEKFRLLNLITLGMAVYFLIALPNSDFTYIDLDKFALYGASWYFI